MIGGRSGAVGACAPPDTLLAGAGGKLTLVWLSGVGGARPPPETMGVRGGGELTLVRASGVGGVRTPPPETLVAGGRLILVYASGAGGARSPPETLAALGGGKPVLVDTSGAGASGAGLPPDTVPVRGGGKRMPVYSSGAGGARAPPPDTVDPGPGTAATGTRGGALTLGCRLITSHSFCSLRGRSTPTMELVTTSQKAWTSPAASQHGRGTGLAVKKDASRSCLHVYSFLTDFQHNPGSKKGSEGKASTVSERRGVAARAACARHAARSAVRIVALMAGLDASIAFVLGADVAVAGVYLYGARACSAPCGAVVVRPFCVLAALAALN